ncbi:hypothetical protein [Rhodococcus koreensis]
MSDHQHPETDQANRQAVHRLRDSAADSVKRMDEHGMILTIGDSENYFAETYFTAAKNIRVNEHAARPCLDDQALDEIAHRLVATFAAEELRRI